MAQSAAVPASASVASFRIAEFAGRPVADQLDLRERLESTLETALGAVPAAARIVLDAADGAIVVFLDSAEAALRCAVAVRERAGALSVPICTGLNAGPVAAPGGAAGEPNVIGDGVATAATVAGFAARDGIAASRAFRDALAKENRDLASALSASGERTDERLRTHELFSVGAVPDNVGRRRLLRTAAISVGAILLTGVAARVARRQIAARRKPALVALEITPWAEVVVDGTPRGRTPPLHAIELAPGEHTIEIRHPGVRPIVVEVNLNAGEETTIRHAFGTPQPSSPLRNLLRKFGL
jgi:class 3 adenylate cyclase